MDDSTEREPLLSASHGVLEISIAKPPGSQLLSYNEASKAAVTADGTTTTYSEDDFLLTQDLPTVPQTQYSSLSRHGSFSQLPGFLLSEEEAEWMASTEAPNRTQTTNLTQSSPLCEHSNARNYSSFSSIDVNSPTGSDQSTKNVIRDSSISEKRTSTDTSEKRRFPKKGHNKKKKYSENAVWCSIISILLCYVVSAMALIPLCTQYFSDRIAEDVYNTTYEEADKCGNVSSQKEEINESIQKDASSKLLSIAIATGTPATLACLCVGSYSDFIGRRILLLAPLIGAIIRAVLTCVLIQYKLNLDWYLLGAFCDGAMGSVFTMTLGAVAIITDISPDPHSRAVRFAVVEGILFIAGAISQVGVGYLIKEVNYIAPALACTCLLTVAFFLAIICPETVSARKLDTWNPLTHIKHSFDFYFTKGSKARRKQFMLGLAIFVTLLVANGGRAGVETLYVLNTPFCWDPLDIGFFNAGRLVAMSIAAVLFLRLTKFRLPLEVAGFVCVLSGVAGFLFQGMADTDEGMFVAAGVGVLFLGAAPVPRALLSQIASPSEQGALFSSMSTMETVFSMASAASYTVVYNATVDYFRGAVFVAMSGLTFISGILLLIYYKKRCDGGIEPVDIDSRKDPSDIGPAHHGYNYIFDDVGSADESSTLLLPHEIRKSIDTAEKLKMIRSMSQNELLGKQLARDQNAGKF